MVKLQPMPKGIWAVKVDNKNNYRFMMPDEEEIFCRLVRNRVTNNCEAVVNLGRMRG